ncbi:MULTISPECIES: phage scaffolding protein [unclassified Oceanobacillus]|uniref:phage scaffolding protein n=1 Tax=unclassified Oceanobacillus TaxID=2630292 RepID=UPI001BEB99F9|nr:MULTISPECIES: phage scaffolding protein [unclassified Oceanobacillus]MBT2599092.1 phage scaffolding protein [Oceanobacillus sp. ISL-74]MBT2652010.1 phage scaffolding protein [Oceanobacillus sp. ISL-73]
MDLKELLGEELYNQVAKKTGDKHKIAIVSDGSYIPKEKFDAVNNEKNDYKQQIADRDTQLDDLQKKAKGNDDLQQTIKDLQKQNDDAKKEHDANLAKIQKEAKLELALNNAKARNSKAVKALLDDEKISLDGDNLVGLDDQLKELQKSASYLFDTEEKNPGLKGRQAHATDPNKKTEGKNPFSKEHFNLTEQGRLYKEDPERYKQLKSQANNN